MACTSHEGERRLAPGANLTQEARRNRELQRAKVKRSHDRLPPCSQAKTFFDQDVDGCLGAKFLLISSGWVFISSPSATLWIVRLSSLLLPGLFAEM